MKILELKQGSPEWLETRKHYYCASDAAAMLGESPYKSRDEFIAEKKTGVRKETSNHQQAIFDEGHRSEEMARLNLEAELLEDLTPVVAVKIVGDLKLLASFDGITDDGSTLFEHKQFNEKLAANVKAESLQPSHWLQLEHQLLVSEAEKVIFVCSDGTTKNRVMMEYRSVPAHREKLLAGWKQFGEDLKNWTPKPEREKVIASESASLPAIQYEVVGSVINSNIAECLPAMEARAKQEMSRKLETDQDFADKEAFNKDVKSARANLKVITDNVKREFVSFAEFADTAAKIDKILQMLQSDGEKKVKEAKQLKKAMVEADAIKAWEVFLQQLNKNIYPYRMEVLHNYEPDFVKAMKGKRTIEGWEKGVDKELTHAKINMQEASNKVRVNLDYLQTKANYGLLNADFSDYLMMDNKQFAEMVDARIAQQEEVRRQREADEAERAKKQAEKQRELIRQEEERKARIKIEREQEAQMLKQAEKRRKAQLAQAEVKKEEPESQMLVTEPEPQEEIRTANYDANALKIVFLQCLFDAGVDQWAGFELAVKQFTEAFPGAEIPY